MAFDNLMDFMAMGKHGFYVWTAYGVSIGILVGLVSHTMFQRRDIRKTLHQRFMRKDTR
ncbi:MAG: heme exporter protein CcmD [Marinomonas sp.]|jgi:heme exporter protein D|uniref:Heme exporter protein D n=1 Tax=Marinomonas pontica TaxID=264739 RepID=A0ABN6WS25_9GAMM|nr:heme exporter protein CcmD [Marinomonas pontica]MCW8357495.1 heme exporter protein CcmD [Marinomonas pontica]BDX03643.1 hypothetical protein MACH16_23910 [Marinomonas pontica]